MGADRSDDSASQAWRQQADGRRARGRQRADVCPEHRLSVGCVAEGSAAAQHGERLLPPLGLRRHPRSHPSRAIRAVPRASRTRSQSERRDHRQPERQECGKRGISIDPPGYDAGKKIKGAKRHILVDTQGLLMQAIIHAADVQDRDGGVLLMGALFGLYPFLLKLYADSGYQGAKFQNGLMAACGQVNLEIVKRSDLHKFVILPKRWIVERTIGWLNRCRRLAKNWECLNRNALAFLRWASVRLMVRKLCQNIP